MVTQAACSSPECLTPSKSLPVSASGEQEVMDVLRKVERKIPPLLHEFAVSVPGDLPGRAS